MPVIDGARQFLEERALPLERVLLASSFKAALPQLRPLRDEAKQRGLWAPHLPKEYGGLGLGLVDVAHISEVLGACPFGHWLVNMQAPDVGNMELLLAHGTDAQKKQFLEPLARGDVRSCFSMTEPDRPGSNPVWLDTTAKRDGDSYVINGHKWFTSSADGAAFAIVMAVTNEDAPPHERASMILVPLATPGVTHVRNIPVMGEAGGDWASHAELRYENVRVPVSNLLGAEGQGFKLAQERLGPGRIHHCMRADGAAVDRREPHRDSRGALDGAGRRAQDRGARPEGGA
jgi:alkylation response protein AidB-like acyl-CoA dehydrogenase